ncbi:MAG: class I SAM-dependent methyltransferase [Saprospiraceae bacterium]
MSAFSKALSVVGVILLMLFVACESKFDSSVKTPISHTHDYSSHDHRHEDETYYPPTAKSSAALAQSFDKKFLEKYNRSAADVQRDDWQKPQTVIGAFGDMQGKTIADIGAGIGYFALYIARLGKAEKVIAIDIDKSAIEFLNGMKKKLPEDLQPKFEGRVCSFDDPNLRDGEADIAIMVNTYAFIEKRVNYLENLKRGMAKGGKLFIIDYKKKALPLPVPEKDKLPLYKVEEELTKAGYRFVSNDQLLDYQYIVMAVKE